MQPFGMHSIFLVEQRNSGIQVSCKSYPYQIGNQQIASRFGQPIKQHHIQPNQPPQGNQPNQSHPIQLPVKKQNRPQEIESQLHAVHRQRRFASGGMSRYNHQIGCNTHQNEQHRPHNGEQPARGRKRRLTKGGKLFHTVTGKQGGYHTHSQRNSKASNKFFPLNFHAYHLGLVYA